MNTVTPRGVINSMYISTLPKKEVTGEARRHTKLFSSHTPPGISNRVLELLQKKEERQ